jgi:lysine-ketoglutarate reductase/saccharopine dehydrogenase-like protein (TIGR00300 family)
MPPHMQSTETVEISGHLMDSGVLARVLDDVLDYGCDYVIEKFDVGRTHDDESYARIGLSAADDSGLQRLLMRLQAYGVNPVDPGEAIIREAEQDGVFPDDFYSTTNLETVVRLDGQWVPVEHPEMDCGLLVENNRVRTIPVSDVKAGDRLVCGATGVRVVLPMRPHSANADDAWHFEFMNSEVSSEKPQALLVRQIADRMREVKAENEKVLWVAGPAVVHTGAAPAMVALVEAGYVDVLFAGNALATHDIESALFGTSLGVDLSKGRGVEHGHEHHIRAINTIRLDCRRSRVRCPHGWCHARAREGEQTVRAGRVGARRRTAARRLRERHRRSTRDARAPRWCRFRRNGRDNVALDRDRQHPAGVNSPGLRRHQPGDGDQARRPRQRASDGDRHRHRVVPRTAGAPADPRLRLSFPRKITDGCESRHPRR